MSGQAQSPWPNLPEASTSASNKPGPTWAPATSVIPLKVAWVYDMNACRGATGVTRHALAQLERLAERPEIALKVVSGRISASEGLIQWESLGDLPRKELPLSMRNALRVWRTLGAPPLEWWSGKVDWAYSPSDYFLATQGAKKAVTCHDILQDLLLGGPRRKALLAKTFGRADLVLSVSRFNGDRLREAFPHCRDKVVYVPNAADDFFFEPAPEAERSRVRADVGLPPEMPFLLSVANFQPRKNLPRFLRAAGKLDAVAKGELAVVLVGDGDEDHARPIHQAIAEIGPKAVVKLPGYRQGKALRAIYAEAKALAFPSLCESFGIPAVEAMAQGVPVALANSTALPEIAGEAGWYFDPENEESITASLWAMLDLDAERLKRAEVGRNQAAGYRWSDANDRLVQALQSHR